MATEYESTVANVHRALRSKKYWLARLADSGVDEARLDSMTLGADGGVEVVTTQVIGSSRLPGFVSQFHRGDLQIRILRDDSVRRRLVAEVRESHVHARLGEPLDDGTADASAAAGDKGDATAEAVLDLERGRAHPEMA